METSIRDSVLSSAGSEPSLERSTLDASGARAPSAVSAYKIWQVVLAASVGTVMEWYDFFIIGRLTAVLAFKFSLPGNTTFAYLAYLAIFAIGLVVRPFGVLFFGRMG